MEAGSREDAIAFLHGRAFVYELGHTVFGGEPDEGLFETLRSDVFVATVEQLAEQVDSLAGLSDYLATLRDDEVRAEELERAVSDYQRVVLGLGAMSAAHPWESFYTNNRQLLFQRETLEVRTAYREFGYLPEQYPRVADDHIALECAFMAALAAQTIKVFGEDAEGVGELIEGQLRFVRGHLMKWLDRFAADLDADAAAGLYATVAAVLAGYLAFDAASLEDVREAII